MPQTPNQQVKRQNLDRVRALLLRLGVATKARLARESGLSVVTLGGLMAELCARGEAAEDALIPSDGGRPARAYRYNADYAHALSLCVLQRNGEEALYASVVNLLGETVRAETLPLKRPAPGALLDDAARFSERDPLIASAGVGIPGQAVNGRVLFCDLPELAGVALQALMEERLGCPVAVENDMNAAAYGYACRARPRADECTVGVWFPVGKAPGAGILLGSRLLRGQNGMAGELGCLPLEVDWANPPEPFERVICDCLRAVTAVLAPERVIVYREGLNRGELLAWMERTWSGTPARPQIVTDESLAPDYELGVRRLALARLLPRTEADERGGV